MSKEKETKVAEEENLLTATVNEEGFALVEKVLAEELDDSDVNKEVIKQVVESFKGQNNITLCRAIESLLILVPLQWGPAMMMAVRHSFSVRFAESFIDKMSKGDKENKEDE